MAHSRTIVLALAFHSALVGCESISSSKQASSAPTLDPTPSSTLNPLSKLERSIVFAPSRYPVGDWHPIGLNFEDAWPRAEDNTRLHGWYVPHKHPRAVVLFCHGNAGNVATWADELRILHHRMRVTVLGFDYRGYGRSEGTPTEAGVLADARAARRWLAQRADCAENQVVIIGRSLGGAVAIDLAASDGARGLVVESSFTSLPEVGHAALPWLPVRSVMQSRFDSLAKIGKYHGPFLQSHGTADRLIPFKMGRQLFEAANEPKQFVEIKGGDHNDPQTAEYYVTLAEFLDKL